VAWAGVRALPVASPGPRPLAPPAPLEQARERRGDVRLRLPLLVRSLQAAGVRDQPCLSPRSPRSLMTAQSIEARVREVVARTFQLTPEQAGGALAMGSVPTWDSLGHMRLIAAVEDEFNVRLPAFAISEVTSVEAM